MIARALLFTAVATAASPLSLGQGTIGGMVVNGTNNDAPAGRSEIILRCHTDGQLVPIAATVADEQGRFRFDGLLIDGNRPYLPGANRNEVHYPGPRIRLTAARPHARVRLVVYDSVGEPNPLVIRQHEIIIDPQPGVVRVRESILIDNPSSMCYVGRTSPNGAEPVTLQLSIPADFHRTTFDKEFFGRQFSLVEGKLVTGIPWPPGQRELGFTYLIPNNKSRHIWSRTVDLPCDDVRVTVHTERTDAVSANLARAETTQPGAVRFASAGGWLPAGHYIRLELGAVPRPWLVHGPWLALFILLCAITAAGMLMLVPGLSDRWNR